MIVGKQQSVNLTFDVQMAGCNEKYSVFAILTMEGMENKLYMNFVHSDQWHDFKFDGINRTKPSRQIIKPITSGYIPQSGGYIMVISERLHFSFDEVDEDTMETTHNSVTSAFLIVSRFLLILKPRPNALDLSLYIARQMSSIVECCREGVAKRSRLFTQLGTQHSIDVLFE